ncbi:MAG: hypothetical protein K2V38_15605, partial [Gemmataceae bacterium]|nr:hypothetical protein [Gemmataceae bacterium]
MPPWTTRWLVWARDNLLWTGRPRPTAVFVGSERGGVARWESPVPWTADACLIEFRLRLSPTARRKTDFAFRLQSLTFPADALKPDGEFVRVAFRVPVPAEAVRGDLVWKGRVLATIPVPVLTPDGFVGGLSLTNPTLAMRFGGTTVAATAFVSDRCDGLLASAIVRAPGG